MYVWKPESLAHFDDDVLCHTRQPACHCHPSWVWPPGAPREGIPEVKVLTQKALKLPAGLACSNPFSRVCAGVHTGHL